MRLGLLICLTAGFCIGCASSSKIPVASIQKRSDVLAADTCAEHFPLINTRLDLRADVERGPWEISMTPSVDRFNTALFKKWRNQHGGSPYIYTQAGSYEYTPHIMNYDLMGDFYYYGCEYSGQSTLGRIWHGKREAIERDPVMAAKHYEFAALGHVAHSQYRLGRMLFEGDGISKDQDMGIKWLTSAALEGSNDARSYLQDLGIDDVPPAISPNTFSLLAREEKMIERQFQRAIDARQQQTRENLGNFLGLAIMTVGAYYAADAAVAHETGQPASSTQQGPIIVQRNRPAFCTSTVNMAITGGTYATYANGTVSTFCN